MWREAATRRAPLPRMFLNTRIPSASAFMSCERSRSTGPSTEAHTFSSSATPSPVSHPSILKVVTVPAVLFVILSCMPGKLHTLCHRNGKQRVGRKMFLIKKQGSRAASLAGHAAAERGNMLPEVLNTALLACYDSAISGGRGRGRIRPT